MYSVRDALVYKGTELCRAEGVDFILAVGGGSVIDSSKAIAIGVPYDGDFWDVLINTIKKQQISTDLSEPAVLMFCLFQ